MYTNSNWSLNLIKSVFGLGIALLLAIGGLAASTELSRAQTPTNTDLAEPEPVDIEAVYKSKLQAHRQTHIQIEEQLLSLHSKLTDAVVGHHKADYFQDILDDVATQLNETEPYLNDSQVDDLAATLLITPVPERTALWAPHREAFYTTMAELDSAYQKMAMIGRELK